MFKFFDEIPVASELPEGGEYEVNIATFAFMLRRGLFANVGVLISNGIDTVYISYGSCITLSRSYRDFVKKVLYMAESVYPRYMVNYFSEPEVFAIRDDSADQILIPLSEVDICSFNLERFRNNHSLTWKKAFYYALGQASIIDETDYSARAFKHKSMCMMGILRIDRDDEQSSSHASEEDFSSIRFPDASEKDFSSIRFPGVYDVMIQSEVICENWDAPNLQRRLIAPVVYNAAWQQMQRVDSIPFNYPAGIDKVARLSHHAYIGYSLSEKLSYYNIAQLLSMIDRSLI